MLSMRALNLRIDSITDEDELNQLYAALLAVDQRLKQLRKDTDEAVWTRIMVRVRRGELLGNGKPGDYDRHSLENQRMPKAEQQRRYADRLLAEYRPLVEAERAKGKTASESRIIKKCQQERSNREAEIIAQQPDLADLRIGDFREVLHDLSDVDAIITDPPYPAEYLPLLSDLSKLGERILRSGGICAVMIGQSYLPEVYRRLGEHLHYWWTIAYLTPGGQSAQIWDRKVNTFWKPVLIFGRGNYEGDWYGDVAKSPTNDNDKNHHHWGQSETGMANIIERITQPGQTIVDPFLGAGTTGLAAIRLGRRFIGCDIDPEHVGTARLRIGAT